MPLFEVVETHTEKMTYEDSGDEDKELPNGIQQLKEDEAVALMEKFVSGQQISDSEDERMSSDGNSDNSDYSSSSNDD